MRVAVCTWNTTNDDWPALAAVGNPGKQEYCDRHGYKFVPQTTEYSGYKRMELAGQLLAAYDMVLSVDADALIMNHTIKAERLYREGAGIVISEDLFGINDGVFAAFGTPLAKQFISVYLGLAANPANAHDSQQLFNYCASIDLYRPIIVKVPQKELNAYRHEQYGRPSWFTGCYSPGDWICQWPGKPNSERIPLMQDALGEVIR